MRLAKQNPYSVNWHGVQNLPSTIYSIMHTILSFRQEYPCIYELESGLIKAESEGYQVTKRKEWLDMLGDKHPLYSLIRVCLNDKSQFRWEMKIIVHELDEIMTKHDCKLPSLKEVFDMLQINNYT